MITRVGQTPALPTCAMCRKLIVDPSQSVPTISGPVHWGCNQTAIGATVRVADATSADRTGTGGPALDGPGNRAERTAERLSGVERGDGAREAVEDLLGPRVMGVGPYGQAVADDARERLHGLLVEAYRLGRADERAAVVDAEAARRALTPHGLTAEQVLAAVGNILGAASADEAARLVWAVRDYVPASGPGRAAGGEGRG